MNKLSINFSGQSMYFIKPSLTVLVWPLANPRNVSFLLQLPRWFQNISTEKPHVLSTSQRTPTFVLSQTSYITHPILRWFQTNFAVTSFQARTKNFKSYLKCLVLQQRNYNERKFQECTTNVNLFSSWARLCLFLSLWAQNFALNECKYHSAFQVWRQMSSNSA